MPYSLIAGASKNSLTKTGWTTRKVVGLDTRKSLISAGWPSVMDSNWHGQTLVCSEDVGSETTPANHDILWGQAASTRKVVLS